MENGTQDHEKALPNGETVSVNSYDAAIKSHHYLWRRNLDSSSHIPTGPCGLSENTFKMLTGVAVVIGIAVSWVGSTQFAQSTYSSTFFAPYFTTWFTTCWMIICYPTISLISRLKGQRFIQVYRESEKIFGARGLCLMSLIKIALPFCLCWMVANFLYIYALGLIASADVTAVFSSTSAFVYVFSLLWLKERFLILRAIATVSSIGGIVLFAYAQGFGRFQWIGVLLTIGASIAASLYKVWLKRVVGNASFNQIALFLSILGLINFLLLWPIILILYFSGAETIVWDNLPMTFLCGSAVLGMVFNFLVNFGIALTFPLFISLGTVIGIPLNAIVDSVFRGQTFTDIKIGGTACIIVGFLIMLINDEKSREISDHIMRIFFCGKFFPRCKRIGFCGKCVRCCKRADDQITSDTKQNSAKDNNVPDANLNHNEMAKISDDI